MQARLGVLVACLLAVPALAQTQGQTAPAEGTTTKLYKLECSGLGG
jgi:hypothetical protein